MRFAKQRVTRSPARLVLTVLAAAVIAAISFAPTSASADSSSPVDSDYNLVAEADDTRSVGRCHFKVEDVDEQNGTVDGRLFAGVRPKNLLVALGNKHVSLTCQLLAPGSVLLASQHVEDNRSFIVQHNVPVTVPLHDGYELCAVMTTTTGSGQIYDAVRCQNSF